MTTLSKTQLCQLTAAVTLGPVKSAANHTAAEKRFVKTALANGLTAATIDEALAAETYDFAAGVLRRALELVDAKNDAATAIANAAFDAAEVVTADRPGEVAEFAFETAVTPELGLADRMMVQAEALTKPRQRKPVEVDHSRSNARIGAMLAEEAKSNVVKLRPTPAVDYRGTVAAKGADKAWFRDAAQTDKVLGAKINHIGPAKLKAFRDALTGEDAEFAALSLTQQNGILIRSIGRLEAAGSVCHTGLVYQIKPVGFQAVTA